MVPVGPGTVERARVADTLESLHHYEPDVSRVVLVDDDHGPDRDLRSAAGALADRTIVVRNPRSPRSEGWSEGVLVASTTGLRVLLDEGSVDWVLKLDTDAVVIAPFATAVGDRFVEEPAVGMIGSYRYDSTGAERDFWVWEPVLRKHMAPLSVWRRPTHPIRTSLVGRGKQRRAQIERAQQFGYEFGEHCQGGSYAVSIGAARGLADAGLLESRAWYDTRMAEDVVMGVYIRSIGFRLEDMVGPGEPFAVTHVGMLGTPEELAAAGHSIVHSVKDHEGRTETSIRDGFRSRRGSG